MRAIETRYRGFRFRSRLEARWAVFMDALQVDFEYEREAYEMDGMFYLPDFWLPQMRCFLEIKPEEATQEEIEKAARLSAHTKRDVYIFEGSPENPELSHKHKGLKFFGSDSGGYDMPYSFCECSKCGTVGIEYCGWSNRIQCEHESETREVNCGSSRIARAYCAAKSHRFEPGAVN